MLVRYESGQVRLPARLVAPMSVAYECTLLQVLSAAEADLNRRLDAEEKALQAKADAPDASAS